ncbi:MULTISPECIES: TatD family hydrolase [Lactobacillus]|uniref:TatD family deoxyribonuclease n=1 Tax=Lactobacillus xujianguonis TaxID=2495899 RepID=A0A437STV8_9LACO|nr:MULTISPECIES: TatD family hydrolase [Lactobacillus]RVU70360.1 TatD family deoxyribonuclease [Lactobacillus xujianguonis]RVU73100.1 TatD family deoxyribonuclease [Lactobacillus xujianguonis]RVU73711.1 TatD family deoxyribonuclease [Lactobacillus xujianguonis]
MEIIDNHTHLNDEPFRGKEQYYLERAKALGVTKIICAGQDPDFNERAIDLAHKFDNVYAMVGLNPDIAKDYNQAAEDVLVKQLQEPKVVALGEVGLDYYWDESPHDKQREVFARQIEVAHDLKMPVDIHTRDAFPDCYEILKNSNLEYGAILHSFNGGVDWLNKFLDLNVYFSYSGVVSFTKATEVHESAKAVPMDRFMVETDAPYLTPKPYRGRQNEPGYVRYVAEAIAELKDISLEEVAQATYANTVRIYGLE